MGNPKLSVFIWVSQRVGIQLGNQASSWQRKRSKKKECSFTSFTRLFIARPKGLALGYSFASLSHKGFPIPSFTIVQSVIGLYLLNVHSLFVRSLLLLHKQACSVLLHKQVYSVACLFLFLHYRSVIRLYKDWTFASLIIGSVILFEHSLRSLKEHSFTSFIRLYASHNISFSLFKWLRL